MTLYEKLLKIFPALIAEDFHPVTGTILLKNDSDSEGDYIEKWNHISVPKPTIEQLNN